MTTYDTNFPADTVEFCPFSETYDILACGTYKLQSSETDEASSHSDIKSKDTGVTSHESEVQKRIGKVLFFGISSPGDEKIAALDEIDLPAVLDTKWSHRLWNGRPLLAAVDAEGSVSFFSFDLTQNRAELMQTISCGTDILCLSADWSNRRRNSEDDSLAVSLSDGSISILRPDHNSSMKVAESWHAHDYEPWIVAWNYWTTDVLYSGGDDLTMKGWDSRQGFSAPFFTNKRFEAGVTTIQSHPFLEHVLAVGSYDNLVRVFDTRNLYKPVTKVDVGGGAWRVKWHPNESRKTDLLVACMHDGFKVLRFSSELSLLSTTNAVDSEVIQRYDAHESLAYGVDWSYKEGDDPNATRVASCSFYDHALHVWEG